jgi:uncharacterized protein
MIQYRERTALVTGASSGIGMVFAEELARRGANLLLAARSADTLSALAERLQKERGIQARALPVDLAQERAADELVAAASRAGFSIDILVNNAGFGSHGRYETLAVEREHKEIMVNVVSLARLTHLVLPGMLQRGQGIIMNVASNAAFQPLPFMATYGATKAFVLSFTEALWGENRGGPVRVLAVCPGPTETPFFKVVGTEHGESEKKRTAHQLVLGALRALERGKICYIDGAKNRLQARSIRLAPRKVVAMGAAAFLRPRPRSEKKATQSL